MITEDYVSFEVANLLKEKGFNEPCYRWYDTKGDVCAKFINPDIPLDYSSREYYLCPSLSMAMKWLREVHKIHIVISPTSGKGYSAILCDVRDFDDFNYIGETDYFFHTEEAVEAALKYVLENLI